MLAAIPTSTSVSNSYIIRTSSLLNETSLDKVILHSNLAKTLSSLGVLTRYILDVTGHQYKQILDQVFGMLSKFGPTKRLVIIGDGSVGKTTLIRSLSTDLQLEISAFLKVSRTPFMEIETLFLEQQALKEKVLVYDLAGQDGVAHPLKILQDQVLGTSQLILLAFSLDRFQSLVHVSFWFSAIKAYYESEGLPLPKMILVATKADQPRRIEKNLIDGILKHKSFVGYVETSSLTGNGLVELRWAIISALAGADGSPSDELKNEPPQVVSIVC